jgi:hypothetical protein
VGTITIFGGTRPFGDRFASARSNSRLLGPGEEVHRPAVGDEGPDEAALAGLHRIPVATPGLRQLQELLGLEVEQRRDADVLGGRRGSR